MRDAITDFCNMRHGPDDSVALNRRRFSGATRGAAIGHSPEAAEGGNIALLETEML